MPVLAPVMKTLLAIVKFQSRYCIRFVLVSVLDVE